MSVRSIAAVFTPLTLALCLSSGCTPTTPAPPPAPPPVTVTVPAPPPAPAAEPFAEDVSGSESAGTGGASVPAYDMCRWNDVEGWVCRHSAEGGYFDVPDDDPGIGSCAGLTYTECNEQDGIPSSPGESESGSSETTGGSGSCTSPDVYDPYQCPGDSELDDGELDSGEIEQSCQFHRGPKASEQELQECQANY